MEEHSMNYIKRELPFIQYNDSDKFKTYFQCPNCHSFNTDKETLLDGLEIFYIKRICYDCGYTALYKAFTKE